jgi:hypothetical protein
MGAIMVVDFKAPYFLFLHNKSRRNQQIKSKTELLHMYIGAEVAGTVLTLFAASPHVCASAFTCACAGDGARCLCLFQVRACVLVLMTLVLLVTVLLHVVVCRCNYL